MDHDLLGMPPLTVHLLDRVRGLPVQTWQIAAPLARIGRSRECEITVADPYVSRLHAELRFREGGWVLSGLSSRGLVVAGVPVTIVPVSDSVVFRLGAGGPELEAVVSTDFAADLPTMSFPGVSVKPIAIDEAQKTKEVQAIADTDSFKALLDKARELRKQRSD